MWKTTKNARAAEWIFGILSFLCNFGLVIAFFIWGLVQGTETSKYTMAITGIVGMVVALISTIFKFHWRTPLILLMGGLYFALTQFWVVLVVVAVGIVLDELVFYPCFKHYKTKATINKEIDHRI